MNKNQICQKLVIDQSYPGVSFDKDGICNSSEFYLSSIRPSAEINQVHIESLLKRKPKSRTIPAKLKPIKEFINTLEEVIHITKLINNQLIYQLWILLIENLI